MKHTVIILCLALLCCKSSVAQGKEVTTISHTTPDYIMLQQSFWGSWKVMHVGKPNKKLQKWYYDSKTDTYYRMKTWLGIYCRIR